MIYLFDTNVVAELTTRAKPDPRVMAWFRSTARPNRFLSVITVAEIEAGVSATLDSVRRARYARALAAVRHEYGNRIAPIGEPEAAAYLSIHERLKAAGSNIDPPDALIAATALANGWTVATRNIKHMARTGALERRQERVSGAAVPASGGWRRASGGGAGSGSR